MDLRIQRVNYQGVPTTAVMTHNDESIEWNIGLFDKMSITTDYDVFEHIRLYWNSLPKINQDKLFEIYKKIRAAFDAIWDTDVLTKELYGLIADLYKYHELADIKHWMNFYSDIILPKDLKDVYIDSHENPGSRERTYLKEDYEWLVVLSIALRAVIPIWGEFISRTKKETGTVFKEYYAYKLLSYSNIVHSEPMERLKIYVEHSLPADKSKAAAILGGVCSEDFPIWILALVLVRRLAVGDVRGIDPTSSLITFIYKYIRQKVQGHDSSFIGIVKDKPLEVQGTDGEANISRLEGYKIKQEIPAGDIAINSFYIEDTERLVLKICPDIDLHLLRVSNESIMALEMEQIWKPQMVLTQWVLKPAMSPYGLLHLNKLLTLKAMAAAQALLWHRGHYVLAGLLSAVEQTNADELQLGGTESRARIPKELVEILDSLFPYVRKMSGKQRLLRRTNPAIDAIDSVASMLSERDWRLTLPQEWVVAITNNPNNRRYSVPHNIKILLANLAISVAKRTF